MDDQLTFEPVQADNAGKEVTDADKVVLSKVISMIDTDDMKLANIKFRNNAKNTSYQSIVINSKATPYRDATAEEITFARVKTNGKSQYIAFQAKYKSLFEKAGISFQTFKSKKSSSDETDNLESSNKEDFIRLDLSILDPANPFIHKIINRIFSNSFSFASFGCCSRFLECSNAKKCVHEDNIYANSCMYRHNLEQGKIFYGVNKNI